MTVNRFNLDRNIPDDVKREVRQRSGFGCVICGSALFTYEHADPEFKDAQSHNPNGIKLLCANHHLQKTKGLLALDTVLVAMKQPYPLSHGVVSASLDSDPQTPLDVIIGNVCFHAGTSILKINGVTLLGFEAPEATGAPPRLTARFFDRSGVPITAIEGNEVLFNPATWDVNSSGNTWAVRSAAGKIDLELEHNPLRDIRVKRIEYQIGPYGLRANLQGMQVLMNGSNVVLLSGGEVTGPCTFDIVGGHVAIKNMNFTGCNRIDMTPQASL